MSEEEWTIVRKSKKASKKSVPTTVFKEVPALESTVTEQEILDLCSFVENSSVLFTHTSYYRRYSEIIENILSKEQIDTIVMLGIGSFSNYYFRRDLQRLLYSNSFWQLLLGIKLCSLHENRSSSTGFGEILNRITCYDPLLMNDFDRPLYHALNIQLLEKSSDMKSQLLQFRDFLPRKRSGREKYLFCMPHCPYRLYCSILYSFWDELDSIIIIGNSFESYSIRRSRTESNRNTSDIVALLTPFFEEVSISSLSKKSKPSSGESPADEIHSRVITDYDHVLQTAFSDLSVMFIPEKQLEENTELQQLLRGKKPTLEEMIAANQQDIELH